MSDSSKPSREYKDFSFRRRYDHFLRFRLKAAQPAEIIQVAKELGFNLNAEEFRKIKSKELSSAPSGKLPLSKRKEFLNHLLRFLRT